MLQKFPVAKITLALLSLAAASLSQAAGLDRSGQDISGFFNDGTYTEIDYAYISTDITGYDNAYKDPVSGESIAISKTQGEYGQGRSINNITDDAYTFMRYGVKADVNDNISIGVFYDEPWGAEVRHSGDNNFVSNPDQKVALPSPYEEGAVIPIDISQIDKNVGTEGYNHASNVDVFTETWTGLVGFKSNGFQVYGGPVLQKAEAKVQLRGNAYGPLTGYNAVVNSDTAMGWSAGVAYSKPEIALNAALTYRSEIEHETPIAENMPALDSNLIQSVIRAKGYTGLLSSTVTTDATVTTPKSVNFNLQTGLSQEYQLLGTLDVRWVPWNDFQIVPPLYNAFSKVAEPDGLPLIMYDKDQWQIDVGLAKRFNKKLAGTVVVGWDSGAGNPVSSLGPIDGYWSLGGGVKYNVTPEWAISAGGKYLKFGDATAKLPNGYIVGDFQDNDGYAAGVKLSYQSQ
ncbi:outer membrane protein transport protein [Psychrobacter arenosus]|uniref:outer membrane protein transport protein n=1 Tax=Psychrobacter arenosus TaxID=256326 RepID=UPI00191A1B56|nr:outer membrane protein transport protein [Psychrobacter arenosus]